MRWYTSFLKPACDRLAALALLLLCLPLLLLCAGLLALSQRGPLLFVQPRTGRHGHLFRLVKFRTMCHAYELPGNLLSEAARITPVGRWMRYLSLDELPQLWNVLKGDMSLIGPRPLLPEYVPLYNTAQRRRLDVKPGITGLTQVRGRNALRWAHRFRYDTFYVEHISPGLDLQILMSTIFRLIFPGPLHSPEHGLSERFQGNLSADLAPSAP
ncbi:Sugar transferase involved in LPS biosynthesis (colanic, teichoic acid) [Catalinimonas alkaloidigena]|uniref:Sugar transferase involved in LPS biosynthesis (Colanic, teichoic acid) n=1 Tax=Catalinimonas alkaloidigena TaxID=1075417 RepID=A0A1G9SG42_9BACT|nr:sugar transferase [Catalinimonas alkaloidigena]SDM34466.1 Sugar transferase involved in LPS biosynthesis (colanic, teichoic acid) [Catalinimonas alkaloidigena]